MSNQDKRQIVQLYFTGQDGSLGYIHGRKYRLVIKHPGLLERLRFGRHAIIVNAPQYCPYATSAAFWANWSYTDPNLAAPKPAAPGTLYTPAPDAPALKLPRFNKDLLRSLGMDDWREFAIDFGAWAHTKDFTYQAGLYDPSEGANFGKLINAYVQERLAENEGA